MPNRNLFILLFLTACGLQPLPRSGAGADDSGLTSSSLGDLAYTPAQLDFGEVTAGEEVTSTISLSNTGEDALTILEPTFSGDDAFTLDMVSSFPVDLAGGEERLLTVAFLPTEVGSYSATLAIKVDGIDESAGIGLSGSASVGGGDDTGSGDGGTTATGDGLDLSDTSLSFGVIDINKSSTQTVSLTNNTGDDVLITDLSSSESVFTVGGDLNPPQVLANGATKAIEITYAPKAEVVTNATITVSSDHADDPALEIAVTGEGHQGCTICAPLISVDTGSGGDPYSFGLFDLSCNASGTITIQNEGDEDLEVTDVVMNNDSTCGTFAVKWGGATTLVPWDTTELAISFSTTESCFEFGNTITDENILHIASNDPTEADYQVSMSAIVTCSF